MASKAVAKEAVMQTANLAGVPSSDLEWIMGENSDSTLPQLLDLNDFSPSFFQVMLPSECCYYELVYVASLCIRSASLSLVQYRINDYGILEIIEWRRI